MHRKTEKEEAKVICTGKDTVEVCVEMFLNTLLFDDKNATIYYLFHWLVFFTQVCPKFLWRGANKIGQCVIKISAFSIPNTRAQHNLCVPNFSSRGVLSSPAFYFSFQVNDFSRHPGINFRCFLCFVCYKVFNAVSAKFFESVPKFYDIVALKAAEVKVQIIK